MQLNAPAPDFELPDLQGVVHKLSEYRWKIAIVNFWSAECPHSERTDRYLLNLLQQWNGDVILLSLAANRSESVSVIEEAAKARRIPQVLMDYDHQVANVFEAVTTPHAFVIDREGVLRYRGAVDDVTFRHRQATRFFLQEAVQALVNGELPPMSETLAYGCTIVREI